MINETESELLLSFVAKKKDMLSKKLNDKLETILDVKKWGNGSGKVCSYFYEGWNIAFKDNDKFFYIHHYELSINERTYNLQKINLFENHDGRTDVNYSYVRPLNEFGKKFNSWTDFQYIELKDISDIETITAICLNTIKSLKLVRNNANKLRVKQWFK